VIANQIAGVLGAGAGGGGGASFESIATLTSTGSSTSLTFSSIPSTYKHLQIRGIARDGVGNPLQIQFNSDTGSNYAWHRLQGNGASTAATGSATQSDINFIGYAEASASTYGVSIIDIADYASTSKNKTLRTMMGYDANGTGLMLLNSGLWMNTAAINSIKIIGSAALTSATTFALYGIKG
jgi:hypothetical protein